MNLELPTVAVELGASARRAFAAAGGVDLARRAEAEPDVRRTEVGPLLERLGVADLQLAERSDADVLCAAGELCRAAGEFSLPYPVVAVVIGGTGLPVAMVDEAHPRIDHGDLYPVWRAVSLDGGVWDATPVGSRLGAKLAPFVADVALSSRDDANVDASLALLLAAWRILGALERALELTATHVSEREQFGKPLATFQAVQFQVADATVSVHALRELVWYTTWRWSTAPLDRVVDGLALRVQALESAVHVLRVSHQLHGATGFCDEHDLSVLNRHLQPQLRLPEGLEATTDRLLGAIDDAGFDSLFGAGRTTTAAATEAGGS